ncbi:MAG: hypothetical protein PHG40_02405 [Candidatus Omnitrophica bacterium]|nr:hypothetical protein [Candidatus Omnitrophota bacterium]
MRKQNSVNSVVFLSRSGCLLPLFIFFNLAFGRIFFGFRTWLIIEAVLILLFMLNVRLLIRQATSFSPKRGDGDVIDTEAEVVEEGTVSRTKRKQFPSER